MVQTKDKDLEKARSWRKTIREASRSGLSIREFCRRRRPATLGQEFSRLPTGLLSGSDPRIRSKVPPAEVTEFEHPRPPRRKAMEAIVSSDLKKRESEVSAAPPELQPNPLRLHQGQIWFPFFCRPHAGDGDELGCV